MGQLRNVRQREAARVFISVFGGKERPTKKNYVMITMPNGALLELPGGVLKVGLLRSQIRRAGLTVEQFEKEL
jgi:hypothetical protein